MTEQMWILLNSLQKKKPVFLVWACISIPYFVFFFLDKTIKLLVGKVLSPSTCFFHVFIVPNWKLCMDQNGGKKTNFLSGTTVFLFLHVGYNSSHSRSNTEEGSQRRELTKSVLSHYCYLCHDTPIFSLLVITVSPPSFLLIVFRCL